MGSTFIWLITMFLQWLLQKTVLFFPVVIYTSLPQMEKLCCTGLGVQKLDNAIHWIISIHRTAQTVSLMRRTHCGGIVIYTVDSETMHQHLKKSGLILASDETELPILVFSDAFERSGPHRDFFCLRQQIKDITCARILKKNRWYKLTLIKYLQQRLQRTAALSMGEGKRCLQGNLISMILQTVKE